VKKTRQRKKLELGSGSIRTELQRFNGDAAMTFACLAGLRACAVLSCLIAGGLSARPAVAEQAGWRPLEVPATAAAPESIAVALFYPTAVAERAVPMGPYTLQVAPMAPPTDRVKGLIIVSHGTGGSELSLHGLVAALARNGYLAAALRHPGDNYLDKSIWQKPGAIFVERPRQASRVIDAVLADPDWRGRIGADARGPLVGAVGHSAGGFTVVALAGGQFDLALIRGHCDSHGADDPIFCGMGDPSRPVSQPSVLPSVADPRIRAVVAMAPVGVPFTASSLQAIAVPMQIFAAENDRWLPPRFHAARIAQNVQGAGIRVIPKAWHFAFMDKVGIPIPTPDGDADADPPGFDRAALLTQLNAEVPAFFDRALKEAP
jgi:predicted dienelactone hydrolase